MLGGDCMLNLDPSRKFKRGFYEGMVAPKMRSDLILHEFPEFEIRDPHLRVHNAAVYPR